MTQAWLRTSALARLWAQLPAFPTQTATHLLGLLLAVLVLHRTPCLLGWPHTWALVATAILAALTHPHGPVLTSPSRMDILAQWIEAQPLGSDATPTPTLILSRYGRWFWPWWPSAPSTSPCCTTGPA